MLIDGGLGGGVLGGEVSGVRVCWSCGFGGGGDINVYMFARAYHPLQAVSNGEMAGRDKRQGDEDEGGR